MEQKLLKLAFIIAIIGILSLFFISEFLGYKEVDIKSINSIDEDKVKFIGVLNKVNSHSNTTFISISYVDQIEIVAFNQDNTTLKPGDKVEILGTKSDDSIIADRIRVIKK